MKKLSLLILILLPLLALSQAQQPDGYVSSVNSSTATLTSGSVFTGTAEDVWRYAEARITVKSDVASATDGLSIQQSANGTNWDQFDVYTIPAATGKAFGVPIYARYLRVVYTNGGTNQTSFQLSTVFHKYVTSITSVRPQDARTNDNDMQENLSYNMNYDPVLNVWNRQAPFQNIPGASAQTATVNNIIPPASTTAGTFTAGYIFGSVQVVSTGTGGTFIFEGANADGNYQTIPVWNQATLTGTPILAAITPTATQLIYYFPITTSYIRVRIVTTITGGSIQALTKLQSTAPFPVTFQVAQATAANLNATVTGTVTANLGTGGTGATSGFKAEDAAAASGDTNPAMMGIRNDELTSNVSANADYGVMINDIYGHGIIKDQQRHKRTYSVAFTVAPATLATDIFQIIGSASTTVEIDKITISGTQTTGGPIILILSKRSTANTGGTSSIGTIVAHNSARAAATTVVTIYTANPTTGTPVGDIKAIGIPIGTTATSISPPTDIIFAQSDAAPVLVGVAQTIVGRLNGVTYTGASLNISIELTEY